MTNAEKINQAHLMLAMAIIAVAALILVIDYYRQKDELKGFTNLISKVGKVASVVIGTFIAMFVGIFIDKDHHN